MPDNNLVMSIVPMNGELTIKGKMKKFNKKDIPKNYLFDFLSKNNITDIHVENGLAFNNGKLIEIDGKPLKML